mmetsp:Transcript_65758/g.118496  ORF Transcript_65758/g.118496 Transcript_65758/m.118496 type:complete len:268 (+) Transcript_65758:57-860(+)
MYNMYDNFERHMPYWEIPQPQKVPMPFLGSRGFAQPSSLQPAYLFLGSEEKSAANSVGDLFAETSCLKANSYFAEASTEFASGSSSSVSDWSGQDQEADAPPSLVDEKTASPGSFGHPELCQRPCLFFMDGTCSSGSECRFCHLAHAKRPPHLDKRSRLLLSAMSFSEVQELVLPIILEKLNSMGCLQAVVVIALNKLSASASYRGKYLQAPFPGVHKKRADNLQGALRVMAVRALLSLLRKAAPDNAPETASLEELIQILEMDGTR